MIKKFLMLILATFSFQVNAGNCYKSSILSPSPFLGNNGEIFKLSDGSFWEIKYEYEYLYEYYPSVIICPDSQVLIIKNKKLNVSPLGGSYGGGNKNSNVIQTRVDGEFEGWEGETIVKLANGQIWQQTEYYYTYHYSYNPSVMIYKANGSYKIKVDGVEKSVGVTRLK